MYVQVEVAAFRLGLPEEIDRVEQAAKPVKFDRLVVIVGMIEQLSQTQALLRFRITARKSLVSDDLAVELVMVGNGRAAGEQ